MRPSTAEPPTRQEEGGPPGPAPFARMLPWLLLVGGAAGLLAAFVLAVEKIALLKDPGHVPSCSINPVFSCGSVMNTPQAEAFGFPNPLLGVAAFAMVVVAATAMLAGTLRARWWWLGLQAGVTFGLLFVHWLIYQSLYAIGALCPYCMVVWAVTVPLFWYVTLHNLDQGHLPGPRRVVDAVTGLHAVPLVVWFLTIITLIGTRFWSYWTTLL
ncbi:vitamin K epoxide reductase family protein [Actinomadura rugatobispora]|uniref:Vitamin K epoxide reductase family protein n=1 Tax=Actinomadura rugatobispora TaxID=1994 RepID=A0ABW1AF42_9ACTN|nr:vitamin K epoxide reductase family protein [Actinomadura rugatobispora]